jgi:hypothetical protein
VEEINDTVLMAATPFSFPASNPVVEDGSVSTVTLSSPSIKRAFTGAWRVRLLLLSGFIASLGLMVFQLMLWGPPLSVNYAEKYTHKLTVSGCQVFADHVVKNVDRMKEIIVQSQIDCTKMPYIYLTGFQYSQQSSLLSCEQPLEGRSAPKCSINNIVRNTIK